MASLTAFLSDAERARAGRFRFEKHRMASIIARGVLRSLLSQYLAQPAESITLLDGPKGKPRIEPESSPHFNVSHSGELAIFAFSRCEIGADIEIIRGLKEMDGIAERFFCADECDQLRSSQSADKERAFFRCWTRKEAYIKAIGEGLSAPLDQFQVTLRAEDTARFVHINNDVNEAAAWTMHNLDIDPTYAGAVAYRHSPRTLRLMAATHPVDILQQLG